MEDDRAFFKELRVALDKKEETLQLCSAEGVEFTKYIEEHLKELLNAKEMFIIDFSPKAAGSNSSSSLKEDVEKSLKEHLGSKIPQIIKIVGESFRRNQLREKKLKYVSEGMQTVDN